MKFRTEIEPVKSTVSIGHDQNVLMLGSCFTDNIGKLLERDGFNVLHNPLGPLYNPASVLKCLNRALGKRSYTIADLTPGPRGYHCLDYASRYSGLDADKVLKAVNNDFSDITNRMHSPQLRTLIITFGTAYVFEREGVTVGNCHKLDTAQFSRRRLSLAEIIEPWCVFLKKLPACIHVIFTVSPIRHLADGLHGNQLSKATLQLAIEEIIKASHGRASYFPAFEIVLDDLRDYRFYAPDMKHPSATAVEYIYEIFSNTYFTSKARQEALESRRRYLAEQHRPIL